MSISNETSTAMQEYRHPAFTTPIRAFLIGDQAWFVVNDLCEAVNIRNPRDAIRNLPLKEKGVEILHTPGGPQKFNIVNESGMYTIIIRSHAALEDNTPASIFRRWVTSEVIPQIRKTGRYDVMAQPVPQTVIAPPKAPSGALVKATMKMIEAATANFSLSSASKQTFWSTSLKVIGFDLPLPVVATGRTFTSTDLATKFGLHPSVFGKKVKHLKHDAHGETRLTTTSFGKQVEIFIWNQNGADAVAHQMASEPLDRSPVEDDIITH